MRLSLIVFIPFFILLGLAHGQSPYQLQSENADCTGIIDLIMPRDSIFGPTTPPSGFGKIQEISGDANSLYAFEQEHNTVWYRFKIPHDCILTFDIIPLLVKDDYDFILYRFNGPSFCEDVRNKNIKPVRTCISRNNPQLGSKTGLSVDATDAFIHSGVGPSYVKAVEAKKDEIYVLVADNVYANGGGHTLRMRFSPPQPVVNEKRPATKSSLSVTIVDKATKELVSATSGMFLKSRKTGEPLFSWENSSSFHSDLDAGISYFIKIEAEGYFDNSIEITTREQTENFNITVELDKIIVGKNVVFDNIIFFGDEARFLPESTPVLEDIVNTLKKNPLMVIEIEGHVNCPSIWETCKNRKTIASNQNLSVNRAKAVYENLMQAGIDPSRMTYKGYGASKMVYPNARSENQQKQNRRVEIVIVSN
jgi:outer membrane protein OmpA-like peptidoglycan-associated protein